jgi:hypothetical protein
MATPDVDVGAPSTPNSKKRSAREILLYMQFRGTR